MKDESVPIQTSFNCDLDFKKEREIVTKASQCDDLLLVDYLNMFRVVKKRIDANIILMCKFAFRIEEQPRDERIRQDVVGKV